MPKWLLNRHRGNRKVHGQPTPSKWIRNSLELFPQAQASLTGVPAFTEHCQAWTNMRYWALPSPCPHTYYALSFHWKAAHDTTMATVTSSLTMHCISKTLHPGLVQIFLLPCLLFFSIIPLLVISQGKMKTHNCRDRSFRATEMHPEESLYNWRYTYAAKNNSFGPKLNSEILNIYIKISTLSTCLLCFQKLPLMFIRTIHFKEMPRLYGRG